MRWLNSVNFSKLHPAMVLATIRLQTFYDEINTELWVTSANDSVHKPESKHYIGAALDFRTHNINGGIISADDKKKTLLMKIQGSLGPFYFCQLEDLNGTNEHLHIQFNEEI